MVVWSRLGDVAVSDVGAAELKFEVVLEVAVKGAFKMAGRHCEALR